MFDEKRVSAALGAVTLLQAVMLGALFAGVEPHPPAAVPLFGIAPFLAMAMAVAVAAIMSGPLQGRFGMALTLVAAILALVSFGPQKYFDPAFPAIWPAVVSGQFFTLVIIWSLFGALQKRRTRG